MKTSDYQILSEAQVGTLKPHGRDHVHCFFFKFTIENKFEIAEWIKKEIGKRVFSTHQQIEDSLAYKKNLSYQGKTIFNIYLSNHCFIKLGYLKFEHDYRNQISRGAIAGDYPNNRGFWKGMYSIHDLGDKEIQDWEYNYQQKSDGMILIADNDEKKIDKEISLLENTIQGIGEKLFVEKGKQLFYREKRKKIYVEPFGFRDGITKINFFRRGKPFELLKDRWKLALDDNYGTYLVFRKLEQNVALFNQKIIELKKELNITKAFAEAQVMGRFKDGTPLTLFSSPTDIKTERDLKNVKKFNKYFFDPNKTNYRKKSAFDDDQKGFKCPFHAHIRKVNPRKPFDDQQNPQDYSSLPKPIIRRSIPYDEKDITDNSRTGIGLLFMCLQKNIDKQFLKIQRFWSNDKPNDYDIVNGEGLDPIAGQPHNRARSPDIREQSWNNTWNGDKRNTLSKNIDFKDTVTFMGGFFLYGPPISFINDPLEGSTIDNLLENDPMV